MKNAGVHHVSLDLIRIAAFLIVFASHTVSEQIPGGLGVTIFFFLSGFLITSRLIDEHNANGNINVKRFFCRRVLRIFPPYYFVLAVAAVLAKLGVIAIVGGQGKLNGVIAQALYAGNYWSALEHDVATPLGTGVFWSLSVEEHFYIVFPIVMTLVFRWPHRWRTIALFAVCVVPLGIRHYVLAKMGADAAAYTSRATECRIDSILYGAGYAFVFAKNGVKGSAIRAYALGVLGAGVLLLTLLIRDPSFRETWRYTIQSMAMIVIFGSLLRAQAEGLLKWAGNRFVRGFAYLTYPLYLVHLIVVYALNPHVQGMNKLLRVPLLFGASLTCAIVVWLVADLFIKWLTKRLTAAFRRAQPTFAPELREVPSPASV